MALDKVRGRLVALALAAAVAIPAVTAVTATGAAAAGCSVVRGGHTTSDLQAAIAAAAPGATLTIGGTCVGDYRIDKSLTLAKRAGASAAVLKGAVGRPLKITDGTVRLVGIRITGGKALDCPAWPSYVCGGGLYITADAKVTLDRVLIDHNGATSATNNNYGGGIYSGGSLTLLRSTVSDNEAGGKFRGDGAGVASDGPLVIRRSMIIDNHGHSAVTASWGGGVYEYEGSALIVDTTIFGNVVHGFNDGKGGGVYNHEGTITIVRSIISGNRATVVNGGAVGGGVHSTGHLTIENSTLTSNTARFGGAASIITNSFTADLTVSASTIARNHGTVGTGGIELTNATLTMGSTILALNTAGASAKKNCDLQVETVVDKEWNLIGIGAGCPGFADGTNGDLVGTAAKPIDPRLDMAADNGGPTPTMALLNGSPAINGAGPAPCAVAKDQRGVPRPQGGRCDIGAYERH